MVAEDEGPRTATERTGQSVQLQSQPWDALTRFLEVGALEFDNNRCERQIRSLALGGRKNYLFAGSNAGAECAAVLYSLLCTCAAQQVDGYSYLMDVIAKLAGGWPTERLDELLPSAWVAARAEVSSEVTSNDREYALQPTG